MTSAAIRSAQIPEDSRGRAVGSTAEAAHAFATWFDGSRAVDRGGRPLVLFHGTPDGNFTSFSRDTAGANTGHEAGDVGFHFTDDPGYADAYSKGYLIESIEIYRKLFGEEPRGTKMPPGAATYPVYLKMCNPLHVPQSKLIDAGLIETAKQGGYDSIVADMGGAREYVVFEPSQIKSAVGNSGKYFLDSADLLDQMPNDLCKSPVAEWIDPNYGPSRGDATMAHVARPG